MRYRDAKKLHNEDEVLIIEKRGKNPILRPETVVECTVEEKDVFVRCNDGHLYHHTALR